LIIFFFSTEGQQECHILGINSRTHFCIGAEANLKLQI